MLQARDLEARMCWRSLACDQRGSCAVECCEIGFELGVVLESLSWMNPSSWY